MYDGRGCRDHEGMMSEIVINKNTLNMSDYQKREDSSAPPVIVLLDANIWEKERLLKSGLGTALLFVVRQIRAMIALPEVTEMEIVHRDVEADGVRLAY